MYHEHLKLTDPSRMAPFAGYLMPLWYSSISDEHLAVREAAGLFDCTHMGVLGIDGPHALGFLNTVTTNDVARLAPGKAQYSYCLDAAGHVLDDVIVYRVGEDNFLLVVNAANERKIKAYFEALLSDTIILDLDRPDRILEHKPKVTDLRTVVKGGWVDIAIQGPAALSILNRAIEGAQSQLASLKSFCFTQARIGQVPCLVSSTGYTGAKVGFEVFVSPAQAPGMWNLLLDRGREAGLVPCGLGARDSLRVEAGLPLYGHELAGPYDLSPLEAGYSWAVKIEKPFFIGKAALQEEAAATTMRVIRIRLPGEKGVRPARQGDAVLDQAGVCMGWVLSSAAAGNTQIALACVDKNKTAEGTAVGIYYMARSPAQVKKGKRQTVDKGQTVETDLTGTVVARFARF